MTSTIRLRAALLACAVTIAGSAAAQSAREPRFKFDGSGTRVIEVSNLPGTEGCAPATSTGRITKRHMENGRVTAATFKDARDEEHINLPDASEFGNRATYERVREALDSLLVPGVQLRVRLAACGAAGRIVVLSSVALVGGQAEQQRPAAGTERAQATSGGEARKSAERDETERVLLQAPGAIGQPELPVQAERSDGKARPDPMTGGVPMRTRWKTDAPTRFQLDMTIKSPDRAFTFWISCSRSGGTVSYQNWFVPPRNWTVSNSRPASIDGRTMPWEVGGADEGWVFTDMSQSAELISRPAFGHLARGQQLVVAGKVGRGRPRDAVFDISGSEAAFASFEARCQRLPQAGA